MKKGIVVSILCTTYNHAKYIRQTLDSFLIQKTSFEYEVLIYDDASTDNTVKIIKEYQKQYPDKIRAVFQKRNLYSKGVRGFMIKYLFPKVRGKYIALCEGDDYWTDPNKLQVQVNFLDSHTDYSTCFHKVKVIYEKENKQNEYIPWFTDKKRFTLQELLKNNYIQTNSVMYRNLGKESYKDLSQENFIPGDWYLHIFHAKRGKIKYFDKIMSVYRRHPQGIWWKCQNNPDSFYIKHGIDQLIMYFETTKLFNNEEQHIQTIFDNIYYLTKTLIDLDNKYNSNIINRFILKYPSCASILFSDNYQVQFHDDGHNTSDYMNKKKYLVEQFNKRVVNMYKEINRINQLLEYNIKLKNKIEEINHEITKLDQVLNMLKSSKFFKVWQLYCKITSIINIKKTTRVN